MQGRETLPKRNQCRAVMKRQGALDLSIAVMGAGRCASLCRPQHCGDVSVAALCAVSMTHTTQLEGQPVVSLR